MLEIIFSPPCKAFETSGGLISLIATPAVIFTQKARIVPRNKSL